MNLKKKLGLLHMATKKSFIATFIPYLLTISIGAQASEYTAVTFASSLINLPNVANFCLVTKDTPEETSAFNQAEEIQLASNNKLFQVWLSCPELDALKRNGYVEKINQWVLIFATMANGKEHIFSEEFGQKWKDQLIGLDITSDSILSKANTILEENDISIDIGSGNKNLGVLAMDEFIHKGFIMIVDDEPVLGIMSSNIIRGVPLNIAFYSYEPDRGKILSILDQAKKHTKSITSLNNDKTEIDK